jgi:ABC-type branched-subunit amino acid transport system ATPase component
VSLELLESLDDARAFEATHRFADLGTFHVPFDELTASESTEAALKATAEQGGKLALIGRSGAGKSSVIASVLGPLTEDLAEQIIPIRIPVAAEDAETATNPGAFARHLLRTVIRYATEILSDEERQAAGRAAADRISRQGRQRTHRFTFGAPKLVADAGLASEVKSGAEEFVNETSAGDAVDGVARLIEVFRSHEREPFLIIDDSDRWIRIGDHDLLEIADAFFMGIVPMLARESGCGFVIAVHDEYLGLPSYRTAQELLTRTVALPLPVDPNAAIATILDKRMELAGAMTTTPELLEPGAADLLGERYREDRSLRRMLAAVDRATQRGCADGADILSPDLIQTAFADLL